MRNEFNRAIGEVIDSGAFAGGPFVEKFEEAFASYCGCRYAIGVGSGTEALWLSLLACGIGLERPNANPIPGHYTERSAKLSL